MTPTKVDIVDDIAEQIGYTQKISTELVETLLELIKSSVEAGDDVLVSGFGKFLLRLRKNAGEEILQPAGI